MAAAIHISSSSTKIDYCDSITFDWSIEGSLDEIKTLTGRGKISSENFKAVECQNTWQLIIDETNSGPDQNQNSKNRKQDIVKIYLKLIESGYPPRTKIKYRCDSQLRYNGSYIKSYNGAKIENSSIVNLNGSDLTEMTIQLYSMSDKTFRNLKNVNISCNVQSAPQMVNVNCCGKKVWEIRKPHRLNNWVDKGVKILSKILDDYSEDIVVICKGAKFNIHKFLLTSQSEVFARMFKVNLSEKQNNRIVIEDFEPEIVQVFMNYLKNVSNPAVIEKELEEIVWEKTMELFKMSHKYEIDDLKTECEDLLCQKINLQNAFEMLEYGKLYDLSELEESAMKFILSKKKSPEILKVFERLAVENPKLLVEIQSEFWENY